MTLYRFLYTASFGALIGCGQQPGRESGARAEQEVRSQEAAWLADWHSHDVNRVVARYADDAHVNYSGAAFLNGRDNIRKGLATFLADPTYQLDFRADRARGSGAGDLVVTGGDYRARFTDPANHERSQETGQYLTIWQKQSDGRWKVVEDMTAVNPPAPAPSGR